MARETRYPFSITQAAGVDDEFLALNPQISGTLKLADFGIEQIVHRVHFVELKGASLWKIRAKEV